MSARKRDANQRHPNSRATADDEMALDISEDLEVQDALVRQQMTTASPTEPKAYGRLRRHEQTPTGRPTHRAKGLAIHDCPHQGCKLGYSRLEHVRRHHDSRHPDCDLVHPELRIRPRRGSGSSSSHPSSSAAIDGGRDYAMTPPSSTTYGNEAAFFGAHLIPDEQMAPGSIYDSVHHQSPAHPHATYGSHTQQEQSAVYPQIWTIQPESPADSPSTRQGLLELTAGDMCLACKASGQTACHIGSKSSCLACVELDKDCLFAREISVIGPIHAIPFKVLQGNASEGRFQIKPADPRYIPALKQGQASEARYNPASVSRDFSQSS